MTPPAYPKVSVIVTCRNNQETIRGCLQALTAQDYPKNYIELIVIDACSTDNTATIAKQYTKHVHCLPINAAAAYNQAMNFASHDILGFVDADAQVECQWLQKLVPHLEDPKVAGVSGDIETWNVENPIARSIGYEIKSRYNRIHSYTGRIATMNLLLKKTVIAEAGGWDENLPSQYDTDLGYRISQKGYKIAYEPNAKCYHYNRPTIHAYWRQQKQYGKNTLKLYLKHSHLAKGDEITDFGMNIQPALMLTVLALLVLGAIPLLRLLWFPAVALLSGLSVYYVYLAAKISLRFGDWAAMSLVVLYFVRVFAWLAGAASMAFKLLLGKEKIKS
ncbi:MAG: glycosyltransferase [Candidatus Bathyarchaeota archaeon]|nr:glycosyltransferase [Candidatus Bathyarchaeota archaeon]